MYMPRPIQNKRISFVCYAKNVPSSTAKKAKILMKCFLYSNTQCNLSIESLKFPEMCMYL